MFRSLPFKLYAGLTLAVLLVLIVGFVSINAIQREDEQAELVKHTNKVINRVRQVRYELFQLRGARRAYWATGNARYMNEWSKEVVIIPNRIKDLEELVTDNPVQVINVRGLDSLVSQLLDYWSSEGKIVSLQQKEVFAGIVAKEETILSKLYAQFETVKLEEQRLLSIREKEAADYNKRTRTIIYWGIGILLVVVLLLINSILQVLKSKYKAGIKLQNNLAEMERVNQLAHDKNWILEGVSYINNRIQGVESTTILADKMINALVEYLELPAGVIYFFDTKEAQLFTVASVSVGASSKKVYKTGEGIVGNAALSKTPVLIKDIPPSYWKVESALGEITGNGEIMCIPLWENGKLKGLIELGCFGSFTNLQQSLLNSVGDVLAVAINSYQSRDKIDMLLEELQEQQEELQQTNEELSRQAEELQASEEELKAQEQELKQINIELQERNAIIENARHTLAGKAKELEAASLYKSEFLANMSHELRTPLNSILILAKLMADNNKKNLTEKQVEYAKIIGKSGKDLLNLINDILDLSKIEAGKIELSIQPVTLAEIVTDIRELFTVVAAEKKVNFNINLATDAPAVIDTDKQRIEQVIKNLLSNAFKFTPKDGNISLLFSNKNKFSEKILAISVSDTGIGISEEKQQLIFEAFQQADGTTSRKYGGTGLGLSISKELVKLLGGRIEVFSEEGRGSTFTVLLPYKYGEADTYVLSDSEDIAMVQRQEVSSMHNSITDDRESIRPGDKVILIIEDDVNFATITRDIAREKGYKTIVALQGDEGLLYAKRYRPAAIILDMQLPVMDGWTLLKKFKADTLLKNVPVHIISAFDDNRLEHAGVLAYLKKPINAEALEKAFATLQHHIEAELKRVLIVSGVHFDDHDLYQMFQEKNHRVVFDQAYTIIETAEKLKKGRYDCIIINIGNTIGIHETRQIRQLAHDPELPVIICLDKDITTEDEMQLKKVSNVIVQHAATANSRLIDELELFLYKMRKEGTGQGIADAPGVIPVPIMINDTVLVNKKVLLVDDDMRNVFALSAILESGHMNVIAASDGKEALTLLQDHTDIDIVLMDIMMPEMDGYEAMERIRKDLKLLKIPIIAVTAKAMTGDRDKCIAAGASDYITKPIDMKKLFSVMRVWLTK